MREFEILCPIHGEIEKLQVPDSYENFTGEVTCPTKGDYGIRYQLQIKIGRGDLISVERAK